MKKMKRWASVLLTVCMLMAMTSQPAMATVVPTATQTATNADPMCTPASAPTSEATNTPAPESASAPMPEVTGAPTSEPTDAPTSEATDAPTSEPTEAPTPEPTDTPTPEPTEAPTSEPTSAPTAEPTDAPTPEPTSAPTPEPTSAPTPEPTDAPTPESTGAPTDAPAAEPLPMLAAAPVVRAADVILMIEVDREKAPEGESLQYIVTLTNAGDSATERLSVNISVPEDKLDVVSAASYGYTASWDWDTWVWKVLPLEPGQTAKLSLTANVLTVETGEAVTVTASIPGGPSDNASFTGIGEYRIQAGRTIITGSVNLDDVPTYSSLIIEATGTVTGGVSYGREVRNAGTITGGTLNGSVDNKGGTITGGTFYDSVNNESGTITGGMFYGSVDNEGGTITGGTFNGNLSNNNGGRVQGQDANVPTINGAIENESGSSILQPCNFGGNAHVTSNTGAIQVSMFVNGEAKTFNYGDNILESLGGGTWCLLNEDNFSICGANDTFGLQTRSYGVLSAPNVVLDYETESITVTVPDYLAGLTAEDGVHWVFQLSVSNASQEWNDIFANSGSYTNTLANLNSFNQMFGGGPLPRDAGDGDVEIPVWFGYGTRNGDAYPGAETTLTIPDRPECGQVEPLALITDVDRLGIDAALCDTYDFGLAPADVPAPGEPTILDEDGDGLITGLNDGEEYIVFLRLKATDSSFRSAWQAQGSATTVAATYTVTYTDGVDGEEVFADQTTRGLLAGAAMPEFEWGEGTYDYNIRVGYVLTGWTDGVNEYSLTNFPETVSGNVTFTAIWEVCTLYVRFYDGQGQIIEAYTLNLVDLDAFECEPPAKDNDGNTIYGWHMDKSDGALYKGTFDYDALEEYAGWGIYEGYMHFHADYNYAQILYDKNDLSGESAPGEVLTLTDASALLAGADQFAREGMVLTGWCETADGSGAIFKPGAEFSISEDALKALYASGDPTVRLYAIWQPDRNGNGIADGEEPKYTVTYTDGVDGVQVFADQTTGDLLVGEATPAFNGTPEREGYMFTGWNPAVAATVSGNATYTATWKADRNGNGIADEEEQKHTVTYTDGVDGEEIFADQATGNLLVGDTTPVFSGTPERAGYVFAGWNPAVAATVSGDATYTAVWKVDRNGNGIADEDEPKYTVTYTDGVNGEEVFADQVTGDLLTGDATPAFNGSSERVGYVFAGWNPAVAATVSGNATYTATWKVDRNGNGIADEDEPKYTVTYADGVDGEEVFADQVTGDLLEGEATPAFSGTPERAGYVFAGWNPAVAATVSGDTTYTATWKKAATDERDGYDPAETAQKLAAGEAVEGVVTNRHGEFMPYKPSTQEVTDEKTQEALERTLVIAAGPVRDEDGEIVLLDGEPVYEQRNLRLSRELLEALSELGYTHIRFVVKDAALEWAIADMTEDGNIIRLAPMEADELSQREREAIGEAEQLSGSYRARITAVMDGEETDITAEIPSLTAQFDAETIRELTESENAQCLLVPGDGEPETVVTTVQYVEDEKEEEKKASYQAALAESGLMTMILQ